MKRLKRMARVMVMITVAWTVATLGEDPIIEAGEVMKAPSFPTESTVNAWMVIQIQPETLNVVSQPKLTAEPSEPTPGRNTFLLLMLALDARGQLKVATGVTRAVREAQFACIPPPTADFSGLASIAGVVAALVIQKPSETPDGVPTQAFTKFTSETALTVRQVAGPPDACGF